MSNEPCCAFLLVRRLANLERAGKEAAAYLSTLRRRSRSGALEVIQGIWIDEAATANLPLALVLPDAAGTSRSVRIAQATGIEGVWMLYWLEASARTASRADLVAALRDCVGDGARGVAAYASRFVPVFNDDASACCERAELRLLEARYPGLVHPAVCFAVDGDRVLPPRAIDHA